MSGYQIDLHTIERYHIWVKFKSKLAKMCFELLEINFSYKLGDLWMFGRLCEVSSDFEISHQIIHTL